MLHINIVLASLLAMPTLEPGLPPNLLNNSSSQDQVQVAQDAWKKSSEAWNLNQAKIDFEQYEKIGRPSAADYILMSRMFRVHQLPEESAPVIARGFQIYRQADVGIEQAWSFLENGELSECRKLLGLLATLRLEGKLHQDLRHMTLRVSKRKLNFEYTLTPNLLNVDNELLKKRGYYEFYIRPNTAFQQTEVTFRGALKHEWTTDPAENRILRLWPTNWQTPVIVNMLVTQTPTAFELTKEHIPREKLPPDIQRYLDKTVQIDPDGRWAQFHAKKLRLPTRDRTIENIRAGVLGLVKYEPTVKPGEEFREDSETVLERQRGHCWQSARAMVAVLRAAGIPARRVFMMNIYGGEESDLTPKSAWVGGHVMAEIWDPKIGWLPIQDRPAAVSAMRYIPLASEFPEENDPAGTPERVFNWTWYGGGNPSELSQRNIKKTLISFSLDP